MRPVANKQVPRPKWTFSLACHFLEDGLDRFFNVHLQINGKVMFHNVLPGGEGSGKFNSPQMHLGVHKKHR